ncbi:hypothetical protein MJO29_006154 [Puccinia striiformis f. sp. tritici]|nr:hypothetical protein MJO29_006154 [Puccinia striiformis f. sp. tritici]
MAIDLAPKSTNPAGGFVHRPRVAPDSGGQAIATDTACLDPLDVVDQNVNQWMAHRSYKLTAKILTVRMALRRLSCRII